MNMNLPSAEDFEAIRLTLFHIFDLVLWVLAMVTVVAVAVRHIPKRRDLRRNR
jgi:hypothetical protein